MPDRDVNAKEFLNDVASGADDDELREKYKLTPLGLQNLFRLMAEKGLLEKVNDKFVIPPRSVSAQKISRDILWGMTGARLMKKYRMSPAALQFTLRKLLESKVLDASELGEELTRRLEAKSPENIRQVERLYLDFDVQIFALENQEILGLVHDISPMGVGVTGIEAKRGQVKTLVVLGDALGQVRPFQFTAECRWANTDDATGEIHAGFEITEISEKDAGELLHLMKLATMIA